MSAVAKGTFTVEMKPQSDARADDGVSLGRMSLDKRFEAISSPPAKAKCSPR